MAEIQLSITELTAAGWTPTVYELRVASAAQRTKKVSKLLKRMLKTKGGIFQAEVIFPSGWDEEMREIEWYTLFATAQGYGGKLRVIEDDQDRDYFRFFVYRIPADRPGNTLAHFRVVPL